MTLIISYNDTGVIIIIDTSVDFKIFKKDKKKIRVKPDFLFVLY